MPVQTFYFDQTLTKIVPRVKAIYWRRLTTDDQDRLVREETGFMPDEAEEAGKGGAEPGIEDEPDAAE